MQRLAASLLFLASAASAASSQHDCSVCATMVQAFSDKFLGSLSSYEFQKKVDYVCHGLLGDQVEHCTDLNKKYGRTLYNLLRDKTGAESVCRAVGFCDAFQHPMKLFHFDCSVCKTEVTHNLREISGILKENIERNVCTYLDDYNVRHCQDLAEQFVPFIDMLADSMDLGYYMCSAVDICKPRMMYYSLMVQAGNETAPCRACRYIFETIKPLEKIEGILDPTVCQKMLPMFEAQCEEFVNKYGAQLKEAANKYLNEKEACDVLLKCGDESQPDY